jgi:hypothetical protein
MTQPFDEFGIRGIVQEFAFAGKRLAAHPLRPKKLVIAGMISK